MAADVTLWSVLSESEQDRWRLSIACETCGAGKGEPCRRVNHHAWDRVWCLKRRVLAKQAFYAAPSCYNCGVRYPEAELEDHEDACTA